MHIHILGICGTFMGGVAALAKQAGHHVTGCDANVYPPMSVQLDAQGIDVIDGYDPTQIQLEPDLFIIGNVISRGNPLIEEILNRGLPYTSGPQWLGENILHDKWVLAVAGTHGKTTTAAMLAWILEYGQLQPGFLIGGVPLNFDQSARLTSLPFFVVEADEYDTAFFDKRAKFIHYHPRTVILNNLEYDHADIFPDLAAIETQFHHLVRTVPGNGLLVINNTEASLARVLRQGCWTPQERFGDRHGWYAEEIDDEITIILNGTPQGILRWNIPGAHNRINALAAIAAARHAGVPAAVAIDALTHFRSVKRRLEVRGVAGGITVYDDFAHHPTAIRATLEGLRHQIGSARILAILEPRSNTMRQGVMKAALPDSLRDATHIFCYAAGLTWDAAAVLCPLGTKAKVFDNLAQLITAVTSMARPGDHVLVMSNGAFGDIHDRLLAAFKTAALPK